MSRWRRSASCCRSDRDRSGQVHGAACGGVLSAAAPRRASEPGERHRLLGAGGRRTGPGRQQGRFPTGFSVATTDAQHNAGRYAFTFPGGVFTVRREPHDDEKDEGRFMQESFKEVTGLLDQQGAPDAKDAMRVWIKIAPAGGTRLTALDRYDHRVKVYLTDLLTASAPPSTPYPGSTTQRTQVRSSRKPEQDSAAA